MPRRLSPSVSPVLPAGLGYHGPSTSSQYHDENVCRNSDTDNNLLKLTDSQAPSLLLVGSYIRRTTSRILLKELVSTLAPPSDASDNKKLHRPSRTRNRLSTFLTISSLFSCSYRRVSKVSVPIGPVGVGP